jgi:hypothetical protein
MRRVSTLQKQQKVLAYAAQLFVAPLLLIEGLA